MSDVSLIKYSHCSSLTAHTEKCPSFEHVHSPKIKKLAAYPAMIADNSKEMVEESLMRRTIHQDVLKTDPGAFRRKNVGLETTTDHFFRRHQVKDFLLSIHPFKDPLDTFGRKMVYSRRPEIIQNDLRTHQEDFLQPHNPTLERSIGYNKGHVRSVLELDTFGPNHSAKVEDKRNAGSLPQSPNVDRNRSLRGDVCTKISKDRAAFGSSGGLNTSASAPAIVFASSQLLSPITSPQKSPKQVLLRREPSIPPFSHHQKTTGGQGGKGIGTCFSPVSFHGMTAADKLLADPHTRGLDWHSSYIKGLKRDEMKKISKRQKKKKIKEQKTQACEFVKNIDLFECKLDTMNSKSLMGHSHNSKV